MNIRVLKFLRIYLTFGCNFIEQDFSVKVNVIQADFSKGQAIFDHIAKELDGLEIGILSMYYLLYKNKL